MTHEDTIVALSTPPGIGAIAVIRLSGKDAIVIAEKVFKGKKLSSQQSHTLHHGYISDPEKIGAGGPKDSGLLRSENEIDEVVIGIFRSPNSYTKEDVVEISSHGSAFITQKIIQLLIRNGAR